MTDHPRLELQGELNPDGFSRPRLRCWADGDGRGNALLYVGVEISTQYSDPGAGLGLQMVAAPGSVAYRLSGWILGLRRGRS